LSEAAGRDVVEGGAPGLRNNRRRCERIAPNPIGDGPKAVMDAVRLSRISYAAYFLPLLDI
jgi:hypothetical protein